MDLSPTAASKAADAVTALLAGGTLRLYDAGRAELVALRFANPAFAPAAAGLATAEPLESGRARATGEPVRFRAFDAKGGEILSGSVGPDGSRADLTLRAALIVAGGEFLLHTLTYRQPTRE